MLPKWSMATPHKPWQGCTYASSNSPLVQVEPLKALLHRTPAHWDSQKRDGSNHRESASRARHLQQQAGKSSHRCAAVCWGVQHQGLSAIAPDVHHETVHNCCVQQPVNFITKLNGNQNRRRLLIPCSLFWCCAVNKQQQQPLIPPFFLPPPLLLKHSWQSLMSRVLCWDSARCYYFHGQHQDLPASLWPGAAVLVLVWPRAIQL